MTYVSFILLIVATVLFILSALGVKQLANVTTHDIGLACFAASFFPGAM